MCHQSLLCPASFGLFRVWEYRPLASLSFLSISTYSLFASCRLQEQRPSGNVSGDSRIKQTPTSAVPPLRSSPRKASHALPRSPVLPPRNLSASPKSQSLSRKESPSPSRQHRPGVTLPPRAPPSSRVSSRMQAGGLLGETPVSPAGIRKGQRGKPQILAPATKGRQVSQEGKATAR